MSATRSLVHPEASAGRAGVLIAVVACVVGAAEVAAQVPRYDQLAGAPLGLVPCDLPQVPGEAWCGSLSVLENREDTASRRLDLNLVVLRATNAQATQAVFYVSGGPGSAATQLAPVFGLVLPALRQQFDIVLIDRRGTGGSNALQCTFDGLNQRLRAALIIEADPSKWSACRAALDAEVAHYSTEDEIEDLEAVRAALGLGRINVMGSSYGTRVAHAYAMRFPERVRTMVLQGVVAPGFTVPLDVAPDVDAAVEKLVAACGQDDACGSEFPDLHAELEAVVARLDQSPVVVRTFDVQTRDSVDVEISRAVFMGGVRTFLNGRLAFRSLPFMIHRAYEGDFTPFAGLLVPAAVALSRALHLGTYLSVVCAEDLARIDAADAVERAEQTLTGPGLYQRHAEACRAWGPLDPVSAEDRLLPVRAPTLLISGSFDPVTPPRWGEAARRFLPNSVHLINPTAGHADSIGPCEASAVVSLINAGRLPQPASECEASGGLTFRVR